MTKTLLLKKDENVCKFKPLFDFLQKKDLKFLDPIDVTLLVDSVSFPIVNLPKVYLWNQISDPNLGIHDFLMIEDANAAKFKWVVVDQEILPIEEFCDKDKHPSDIQLWDVMNALHEKEKFATYFVAEGNYEGKDGFHFCLTPYNDTVSCAVLETLFGTKFVKDLQEQVVELPKINLNDYFNPDAVEYANVIFIDHCKKTLGLSAVLL